MQQHAMAHNAMECDATVRASDGLRHIEVRIASLVRKATSILVAFMVQWNSLHLKMLALVWWKLLWRSRLFPDQAIVVGSGFAENVGSHHNLGDRWVAGYLWTKFCCGGNSTNANQRKTGASKRSQRKKIIDDSQCVV